MSLLENHLQDLRASGLSDEQVKNAGLYSESDPERIAKLLNWKGGAEKLGPCLVIPYLGVDGQPTGYHRLKPDHPRKIAKASGEVRAIKYEAPVGEPNRAYFPPGTVEAIRDPSRMLIITEGEKKALKADQEGLPTICLPGVWAWQKKHEKDANKNAIGRRELIPDLAGIEWTGRIVAVVFDSDSKTNRQVRFARDELCDVLRQLTDVEAGDEKSAGEVFIVELPGGPNGKVGLDDFVLIHSVEDLIQLIADSRFLNHPTFATASARLDEILASGGPAEFFKDSVMAEAIAKLAIKNAGDFGAIRARLKECKISIRDLDRILKPIIERMLKDLRAVPMPQDYCGGFFVSEGCFCRTKLTPEGPKTIPLCNFTASIVSETTVDDGAEQHAAFEIEGKLQTGISLPRVEIPAREYVDMRWLAEEWGGDAIIWPGEWRSVAAAIQALTDAGKKTRRTIRSHTGWIKHNGRHLYLHAGGVIGSTSSDSSLSVQLHGTLSRYNIEKLPQGTDVKESVTRVLSLVLETDETDDNVLRSTCFTVLSAVFRAAFRPADFGLHLVGPSGTFKSEIAALGQQFFGREMDSRNLPGSWSSTANSLEGQAFLAKDALLVIDDFAPTAADSARMHRDADRLFRNQGNNAARGRMRADGSLRPDRPPRGLILSTGEDVPRGHSLRARSLILEFAPGMISSEWLSARQNDARSGIYCGCMRAFLEWLATQYQKLAKRWPALVTELRSELSENGLHARTPAIVAELLLGFRCFTLFARAVEAISDTQREELNLQCRSALIQVARLQTEHQRQSEPADMFMKLLAAVLSSGRGHIARFDGNAPDQSAIFGWRKSGSQGPNGTADTWQAQGRLIGWTDGDGVFLEPDATFAEVQKLAAEQGDLIPVTKSTVWKRLSEKGHLASTYPGRLKVQKRIAGGVKWLVHLRAESITGCDSDDVGEDIF